jgi:hypothetical protein
MVTQLTAEDARQSLRSHLEAKGHEIQAQYGPRIGWKQVQQLLADRRYVRYPCELVFDEKSLEAGEFAFPFPKGDRPEMGFTLYVHPFFLLHLDEVAYLVLYQLVAVNFGDFAGPEDAEAFGAAAFGVSPDAFYSKVCELADQIQ